MVTYGFCTTFVVQWVLWESCENGPLISKSLAKYCLRYKAVISDNVLRPPKVFTGTLFACKTGHFQPLQGKQDVHAQEEHILCMVPLKSVFILDATLKRDHKPPPIYFEPLRRDSCPDYAESPLRRASCPDYAEPQQFQFQNRPCPPSQVSAQLGLPRKNPSSISSMLMQPA